MTYYDQILADIVATLNEARAAAARSVDTVMTATYLLADRPSHRGA